MIREAVSLVLANYEPKNQDEQFAMEQLQRWNRDTGEANLDAALAILTYRPIWAAIVVDRKLERPDPLETFPEAVDWLMSNFGQTDVPLGRVQRMVRGQLNEPLGGGPDVLNAIHSEDSGDQLVGTAGDSYIMLVEFHPEGARSWSLHQFGNSTRPESPHYADQAMLFLHRTLRRSLFLPEDLAERTRASYIPGKEGDALK